MLELININAYYGKIKALKNISININKGEIVTLIGSNGAGKTTTLRAICNQVKIEGSIKLQDKDITKLSTHEIALQSLAHVPEGRKIFAKLTVQENLEVGAFQIKNKQLIKERMEEIFILFPRTKERLKQLGGTMSGGEQQMLAIGRALMTKPQILLLDEPSMGLAPLIVSQIMKIIETLNKQGMTILLIEQNAYHALKISHRGYVIQNGEIILEDVANKLLSNEKVKEAYLA